MRRNQRVAKARTWVRAVDCWGGNRGMNGEPGPVVTPGDAVRFNELAQLGGTDPLIWCLGADEVLELRLSDLLPHAFGPANFPSSPTTQQGTGQSRLHLGRAPSLHPARRRADRYCPEGHLERHITAPKRSASWLVAMVMLALPGDATA